MADSGRPAAEGPAQLLLGWSNDLPIAQASPTCSPTAK